MFTYIAERVWAVFTKFSMSICIFCIFLCTFTHNSIPYINISLSIYIYIHIRIKIASINSVLAQQNVNLKKRNGCGSTYKEPKCDIPKFSVCCFGPLRLVMTSCSLHSVVAIDVLALGASVWTWTDKDTFRDEGRRQTSPRLRLVPAAAKRKREGTQISPFPHPPPPSKSRAQGWEYWMSDGYIYHVPASYFLPHVTVQSVVSTSSLDSFSPEWTLNFRG